MDSPGLLLPRNTLPKLSARFLFPFCEAARQGEFKVSKIIFDLWDPRNSTCVKSKHFKEFASYESPISVAERWSILQKSIIFPKLQF